MIGCTPLSLLNWQYGSPINIVSCPIKLTYVRGLGLGTRSSLANERFIAVQGHGWAEHKFVWLSSHFEGLIEGSSSAVKSLKSRLVRVLAAAN